MISNRGSETRECKDAPSAATRSAYTIFVERQIARIRKIFIKQDTFLRIARFSPVRQANAREDFI